MYILLRLIDIPFRGAFQHVQMTMIELRVQKQI